MFSHTAAINHSISLTTRPPPRGHKSGSHSNQWAHCYDHQGQLPPTNESNHEAKHKCGDPLNEDRHLVSDGVVDLVDITAKEQKQCNFISSMY